ncbi:MAG: hypothetical protein IMF19_04480 [Proteobacteria bacterium]|nr:hypothetical protein [Pseudomonadota bacterium]
MNLGELKDEVIVAIGDTSFNDSLAGWINDSIEQIIDDANVPGFKEIISVNTVLGTAYTTLEATCSGRILYAGTATAELAGGVVTLEHMMKMYPGMADVGDVEYIAIDGSTMYYQKVPATITALTLLHRRKPVAMVADDDEPEGIPPHLHLSVIVPKAAILGFDRIEDGIEGKKVNTIAQSIRYKQGLHDLMCWVAKRVPHRSTSIWSH